MGPGLDCPGKREDYTHRMVDLLRFNGARAGLPWKTRYNLSVLPQVNIASMGPGLDCPGKRVLALSKEYDAAELQWGQGWIALENERDAARRG